MLCYIWIYYWLLVGASNAGSDSNKRQCLKRKEHYDPDLENKSEATCNYCNTNVRGMQEMKEHLIGKKGFIRACNSVPQHVKMELERLLNGKGREKEQSTLRLLPLLPGMIMKRLPCTQYTADYNFILSCWVLIQFDSVWFDPNL